jgi:hypothetical protein
MLIKKIKTAAHRFRPEGFPPLSGLERRVDGTMAIDGNRQWWRSGLIQRKGLWIPTAGVIDKKTGVT